MELETEAKRWIKADIKGITSGKFSHAASVLDGSKLYIMCGLIENEQTNCVSVIDLNTMMARVIKPKNAEFLDSHTAVLMSSGKILVYGGYREAYKSGQLYLYDTEKNYWEKLKPKGSSPAPRASHSAVFYDAKMYIFGGTNEDGDRLKDLWAFTYTSKTWTMIPIAEDDMWPHARSGHSACIEKNLMLIFGGSLDTMQETNDFYSFDFNIKRWNVIHSPGKNVVDAGLNSPITAIRMKKLNDEARKKWRASSPVRRTSGNRLPIISSGKTIERQMTMERQPTMEKDSARQKSIDKSYTIVEGKTPIDKIPSSSNFRGVNDIPESGRLLPSLTRSKEIIDPAFRTMDGGSSNPKMSSMSLKSLRMKFYITSYGNTKQWATIKEEDSPIVNVMKNNIVMRAYYSNRKRIFGNNARASVPNNTVTIGKFPCERDGCCSAIYKGKFYLFGGDRCQMAYNDLFMYPLS